MRRLILAAGIAASLACAFSLPATARSQSSAPAVEQPLVVAQAAQLDPKDVVLLDTPHGRVTIGLRPDLAPKHAERIRTLASRGFYDNVPFHRVIPGFMAQTGDPTGTGTGSSDLPNLPAEFSSAPFKRGTVGMARAGSPNSANSQFFICFDDAPFLEGQYTVIGEVISGMEAVDKIKAGSQANNGTVSNPDKIVRMRLASDGK
ncbi:peptidylprolyl isomerase [Pseudochelatococcus contaminans]|uniref:Peptidyl-prolyl cis-trans isomerase n=1 Tax=Pseudochelatococcus contaminans TaxID=1538103 RepID=A0A7W6EH49_9HYPH|nr:peptidylprolyl isomerase [Pseudochelatococcus contaminans]MBB3809512.1 peptidylprolyl isomerase [Pseudochelatococcus contaminans]